MQKPVFKWLVPVLFTLAFVSACGGGGGSDGNGGEVNPPQPIGFDTFVAGDLANFSSETWTFSITEDTWISVELYGVRLNQAAWTDATFNAPLVTLVDQSNPFGTDILTHDPDVPFWFFGLRDTEIPLYFLDHTGPPGTNQNYAIEVRRRSSAVSGGPYKLRIRNRVDIDAQFGPAQLENEVVGNQNDTELTADAIDRNGASADEIVFGRHEDNDPDFYAIDITASAAEPAVIACFEVVSMRNGLLAGQIDRAYSDLELVLFDPDNALVNIVDDTFFTDPQLCRKVTNTNAANDTYKIGVRETGLANPTADTDYVLKYTEERIPVADIIPETESNDLHASPIPIVYGQFVEGEILTTADSDWFSFPGQPGDMLLIRQFDDTLADDSEGLVKIELFDPVDENLVLPFDGPAKGRNIGFTPADMATRSILVPPSGPGDYRIRVINDTTSPHPNPNPPKTYSFHLQRVKASIFEMEPNNDDLQADFLMVDPADPSVARGSGVIGSANDVDWFELSIGDPGDIDIVAGDTVIVHVYATNDFYFKANDTAGFGSLLEPEVTLYDNSTSPPSPITSSRYLDPRDPITGNPVETVSEGIRAPFPTISAVFEATGAPPYFIRIADTDSFDINETEFSFAYLIEVVNLGQ